MAGQPNPDDFFGKAGGAAAAKQPDPNEYFGPAPTPAPPAPPKRSLIDRAKGAAVSLADAVRPSAEAQQPGNTTDFGRGPTVGVDPKVVKALGDSLDSAVAAWKSTKLIPDFRPAAAPGVTGVGYSAFEKSAPPAPKKSVLEQPYTGPSGAPQPDPMLNPDYVAQLREDLGSLAPEERMPALRDMARGNDVQARAARQILQDAQQEKAVSDAEAMHRLGPDGQRNMREMLRTAGRVDAPSVGGKKPKFEKTFIPDDQPTLVEQLDHATPKQVAENRALESQASDMGRAIPKWGDVAHERSATDKVAEDVGNAFGTGWGQAARATGDALHSIAQIVPETASIAAKILELGTLGYTQPLTDAIDGVSKSLDAGKSAEYHANAQQLAQLMASPDAKPSDVAGFLATHKEFLLDSVIPSVGSMAIGMEGAAFGRGIAGTRAALAGKVGAELEQAEKLGAIYGSSASNALMNAGDTFHQTDGSLGDKIAAAGVAGAGTMLVGRLTEGGAAAQLAHGARRVSSNPWIQRAYQAGTSVGKESVQEAGEGAFQDIGQMIGESGRVNWDHVLKQATNDAFGGGVLGLGGAFGHVHEPTPTRPAPELIDAIARRYGLMPKAAAALNAALDNMDPAEATAYAARALTGFERRGLAKEPGAGQGLKNAVDLHAAMQQAHAMGKADAKAMPERDQGGAEAVPQRDQGGAAAAAVGAPKPDSRPSQPGDIDAADLLGTPLDQAAHQAATSPTNDLPDPTPAQKEAGNYAKGHITLQGLNIAIENPAGSTRSGVDASGTPWETTMQHHYGYIKGSIGADKDHVDVFIGPNHEARTAFVVDQIDPSTGKFDEHKVVLGADSLDQAREIYQANYAAGWKGAGAITPVPMAAFKAWVKSGKLREPLGDIGQTSTAKTDETTLSSVSSAPPAGQDLQGGVQGALQGVAQGGVQGAAPAQSAAFKFTRNKDGTVLVKGDPAAIKAALPGIKGVAGKRGVTFGKSVADKVVQALQPKAAAQPVQQPAPKPVAKVQAPKPKKIPRLRGSRALGAISVRLGGLSPDLLSDLSERVPRVKVNQKTGKKTHYTAWDNPPHSNIGPLFRNGGTADMSEVARVLSEEGYLEPGLYERDPRAAAQAAEKVVIDELKGGGSTLKVGDPDVVESEMQRRREMEMDAADHADPWDDFTFSPDDLEESGYLAADPTTRALTEQLMAEADSLGIDTETIREEVARQVGDEASDEKYHAATQEAIRQAIAQAGQDAGRSNAGATRAGGEDRGQPAEPQGATRSDRADGHDQAVHAEQEGEVLSAQTEGDLRSKAEREDSAAEAERRKKAAEQERLRKEAEGRDTKARADSTVDNFQLGQSAEQQLSGQPDIFSQPAEREPTKPEPKKPTERDIVDLRRRVAALEALKECLS